MKRSFALCCGVWMLAAMGCAANRQQVRTVAESCRVPPIEAERASAARPDSGCAELSRTLALRALSSEQLEQLGMKVPPEPPAELRARCTALLEQEGRFILEPDAASEAILPSGIASPVLLQMQQALARGRTSGGPATLAYNVVSRVGCDAHFPVLVSPTAPFAGFAISPSERWLAAISINNRQYSGATVPYYLQGITLSLVDLRTLEVRTVALTGEFGAQSIALAFAEDRLLVRLKDAWNGGADKRLYLQCRLDAPRCELEPTLVPTAFPTDDVLEVTASTAYRLEARPKSLALPGETLLRTVKRSPDGKHVSYVVDRPTEGEMRSRALFVADVSGENPRMLAEGQGFFHSEWIDRDRLLFDADPAPSPELQKRRERLLASPELSEAVEETASLEGEEKQEASMMLEMIVLRLLQQEMEEGKAAPLGPREVQHERVLQYRLSTGALTPWTPLEHVRLFSEFRFPNVRGGELIEVDPD